MYERELSPPRPREASLAGVDEAQPRGREVEPHASVLRYLDPSHAVSLGNQAQLLRDGVEAYPAMLQAIRGARESVWLETYMFVDDAVGRLFGRALVEAAQRGVKVTVIYDWLGSWGSRRSFFRKLREGGVDVRPFNPLSFTAGLRRFIRRDHRKLLIIDGQVGFVGGVNIAAFWAPAGEGDGWRDDVIRLEGPAVRQLERCFRATWRMQWKDRLGRRVLPADTSGPGGVPVAVLSSRRAIHSAYVRAIQVATESVLIAAAYFVPDRRLLRALEAAARRGVQVSLVMAGKSDHPWLTYAARAFYDRLMAAGIAIYEWHRGVLHSKTAVVDRRWGTIGSFNLERTSLRLNHEVNVVFVDRRLGSALEGSIRQDCAECRLIDPQAWRRRPLWKKALERIAYVFRKVL